jgi:hypothetical protein
VTPEEQFLHDTHRDFEDHLAFCRETCTIRDKRGISVAFEQQPAQRKLDALIQECKRKNKPIRILALKARQVMVSSGTAGEFFHTVGFVPGQKALVVSHDDDSARNIFGYYEQLDESYRQFRGLVRKLDRVRGNKGRLIEYEGGGYIQVETANNLAGGRSFSLRFLHLSEFAFWRDAKILMLALMQSVPDDPDTAVIIESTANGKGGEFYRLWQLASDPTSASDWIAFFFAWWEHPEYTRPPIDPAAFQATLTSEEQQLRDRYNLSLGQLNWRRWAILNKCGGDAELFKQEYPSCDSEAFIASGRPRFDPKVLAKMPVMHDAAVGDLEEVELGPRKVLRFFPKDRGAMVVYKLPQAGHRYVIGVDVAEGIDAAEKGTADPDYSVATVLDRLNGDQVAKVRGRIEPGPFADYVDALARFYNWAFICPEANGPGIAFLEQLLRAGYPPALIYHRRPSPEEQFAQQDSTLISKLGWKTSTTSRVLLISRHDQNLREFGVWIRDPVTLSEHETFVIKANGKAQHQEGCFPPSTLILRADGTFTPIERAEPDDLVVTHKGRSRPIKMTMTREYSGDLVQLKISGVPDLIEATPNHPFWAKRRVAVKNHGKLKIGGRLAYLQKLSVRRDFPAQWVPARNLLPGDWVAIPKRKDLPATDLTPEQLYAIGFWLAEGWYVCSGNDPNGPTAVHGRYIGVGATNNERHFLEIVGRTLKNWFPTHVHFSADCRGEREKRTCESHFSIYKSPKRRASDLRFYSRHALEYFSTNFGNHCDKKRLNNEFFAHSGLLPIVAGFIDGDGSQRKNEAQDVNLYTTSPALAWQFRQILLDNGIWCTLHQQSARIEKRPEHGKAARKRCWVINIKASYLHLLPLCKVNPPDVEKIAPGQFDPKAGKRKLTRHVMEDEHYFYSPIRSISRRAYEGRVHNLHVAGDNSYVAGGVAVHNSHDDEVFALALAGIALEAAPADVQKPEGARAPVPAGGTVRTYGTRRVRI